MVGKRLGYMCLQGGKINSTECWEEEDQAGSGHLPGLTQQVYGSSTTDLLVRWSMGPPSPLYLHSILGREA